MSPFSMLVLFTVIWWTVLFMVLPWGVRSQIEDEDVVKGSEPGAPSRSVMKKKALITTAIALVIFAIVYSLIAFDLIHLSRVVPHYQPQS